GIAPNLLDRLPRSLLNLATHALGLLPGALLGLLADALGLLPHSLLCRQVGLLLGLTPCLVGRHPDQLLGLLLGFTHPLLRLAFPLLSLAQLLLDLVRCDARGRSASGRFLDLRRLLGLRLLRCRGRVIGPRRGDVRRQPRGSVLCSRPLGWPQAGRRGL